ncbi:MAG: hypothetical protein ACI36V_05780 [Coriobacteriales bacterium]
MPPRPKFTKEQVLEAALRIVDSEGEPALTARRLGQELGSSPRPIFTLFEGMQDLKKQLRDGPAMQTFDSFCNSYLAEESVHDAEALNAPFKKLGYALVSFATEKPQLFSFLFISASSGSATFEDWGMSAQATPAVELLMDTYGFDEKTAAVLFRETWMHTFSLCVLRVTGAAEVTDEDVSLSLSRGFQGLMLLAREGRLVDPAVPVSQGQPEP